MKDIGFEDVIKAWLKEHNGIVVFRPNAETLWLKKDEAEPIAKVIWRNRRKYERREV